MLRSRMMPLQDVTNIRHNNNGHSVYGSKTNSPLSGLAGALATPPQPQQQLLPLHQHQQPQQQQQSVREVFLRPDAHMMHAVPASLSVAALSMSASLVSPNSPLSPVAAFASSTTSSARRPPAGSPYRINPYNAHFPYELTAPTTALTASASFPALQHSPLLSRAGSYALLPSNLVATPSQPQHVAFAPRTAVAPAVMRGHAVPQVPLPRHQQQQQQQQRAAAVAAAAVAELTTAASAAPPAAAAAANAAVAPTPALDLTDVPDAKALPAPMYRIVVQFRFRHADYASHVPATRGQFLLVEGDRGVDMGAVVRCQPIDSPAAALAANGKPLPRVLRVAADAEVHHWRTAFAADERVAVERCRERVARLGLDMDVQYAAYQFDRKVLVFYYESRGRIEYGQLLKDLFREFSCRIWLEKIPHE